MITERYSPKKIEKQRRLEESDPIYGESRRRLFRISQALLSQNAHCSIQITGVAHAFSPGPILQTLDEADVVTLELIRGAVSTGLSGEPGNALKQNQFWREIIEYLKKDSADKVILGIAANRDARIAGKRLNLHNGTGTLGSAIVTVEIKEDSIDRLDLFLSAEQQAYLKRYKWIMIERPSAIFTIWQRVNDILKKNNIPRESNFLPLALTDWLTMSHYSLGNVKEKGNLVSFMLPPDPSVLETQEKISKTIEKAFPDCFSPKQLKLIVDAAISAFIYSHSDLTEAREITYALDQLVKKKGIKPNQQIKVIHIGGAMHARGIYNVLLESLPHETKSIEVIEADDLRIGPSQDAEVSDFFQRNISFSESCKAVSISDHELRIDSEKAAKLIELAIEKNPEDLLKRVLIDVFVAEKYKKSPDTFSTHRRMVAEHQRLYTKDIDYLLDLIHSFAG